MLSRLWGRILCMLGLHRWWRSDGFDFSLCSPHWNEEMRCVCVRPDCTKIHLSTADRQEVVRAKFEVIDGGGQSDGSLSIADLRLLPPPCHELDRLFDEIVAKEKV